MSNFGYGYGSRPRAPIGSFPLIAFAGDSVTHATIGQNTATLTADNNRGASFWVPALTKQRVRTRQNLNFGVSGDTSAMLLARIGPILSCDADIIVVHIGTNGVNGAITGTTFSNFKSNLTAIWSALLNAGKVVIAVPPLPRDIATAANRVMLWQMINWVREQQWAGHRNFYVVDPSVPFVNPLSATGAPRSGFTYDGLHPMALGAFSFSKPVADLLNSLYPAFNDSAMASVADVYDATNNLTGNLLVNGMLTGTGGSITANGSTFTGQIADSYIADVQVNGATVTSLVVAASKGTNADGSPHQQFALSGTYVGGFATAVSFRRLATNYSSYTIGDTVVAELEYELDGQAAAQNISGVEAALILTMGGVSHSRRAGHAIVSDQLAAPAHVATLRTSPIIITAVPTAIQCGCNIVLRQSGASTLTAASTVRIKGMSLRKVIP